MNKRILSCLLALIFILSLSVSFAQGQESFIKGRWNVRLKGAPEMKINTRLHEAYLMLGANYGFHPNLEAGLDVGFKHAYYVIIAEDDPYLNVLSRGYRYAPSFNVHLNYHLLPYLLPGKNLRFDAYLTVQFGGVYLPKNYYGISSGWNTLLGGGISYYFTRHLGLNVEMGKEWQLNYKKRSENPLRLGLIYKF